MHKLLVKFVDKSSQVFPKSLLICILPTESVPASFIHLNYAAILSEEFFQVFPKSTLV